jgi:hypothetical protein
MDFTSICDVPNTKTRIHPKHGQHYSRLNPAATLGNSFPVYVLSAEKKIKKKRKGYTHTLSRELIPPSPTTEVRSSTTLFTWVIPKTSRMLEELSPESTTPGVSFGKKMYKEARPMPVMSGALPGMQDSYPR